MSEEEKGSGGAPENSGGVTQETEYQNPENQQSESSGSDGQYTDDQGNVVSYQSYLKLLNEKKKVADEKKRLEEERQRQENERLESEGKKDELIEKLKQQVQEKDQKFKEKVSTFVNSRLEDQVKAEASKMGCIDPDAVVRLADLSKISMDEETLQADTEHIRAVLDEMKNSRPYFFGKQSPNIDTSAPTTSAPQPPPVDLKNKSVEELKQLGFEISRGQKK